jgi:ABC-type proline/glycine betaine transport system ATPase subunit
MIVFIFRIQRESKIGIVYVTHDIRDLERITDHVAVMQNGRLLQFGDKDDVFNNAINPFVERLLRARAKITSH